ncbi:hypothetical protein ANCCEY_06503 [Ancylostoma ceylanicum]|uniref:Uncharacterized protein n=1 Tax=Ancylostoma ceylanicum TaxID=53326 RepID=A0A0D6M3D6_9BILA|nr:hypothetical protein ANCCEY_06503 [Ancylostoma ceylanicum]
MFVVGFYALCVICAILYYYTRTAVESVDDPNFKSFQRTYIIVYLLAVVCYIGTLIGEVLERERKRKSVEHLKRVARVAVKILEFSALVMNYVSQNVSSSAH